MTTTTTIEIPKTMQGRALAVEAVRAAPAGEGEEPSRVFDLTFSSEQPVRRHFGDEILGHAPGEIRLDRLQSGGAPLLLDHRIDDDNHIGVVESVTIKAGRGHARVRLFDTARADEQIAKIAKKGVSVGYEIHKMQRASRDDESRAYRVTDWEPKEISLVPVAADPSVGLGRADPGDDTKTIPVKTSRKEAAMPVEDKTKEDAAPSGTRAGRATAKVDEAEVTRRADERVAAEMKRRDDIDALGARFNMPKDHREKAVRDGVPAAEYQGRVLDSLGDDDFQRAQTAHASVGLTNKEAKRFSFVRAARYLNRPTSKSLQDEARFEIEVSEAAQEHYGRTSKGILVPADVWGDQAGRASGQRSLSTAVPTAAGVLVETELRASEFIDILRDQTVALAMGARAIRDLTGDLDIPRQTGSVTVENVAEDGAASESNPTVDLVSLSPHTITANTYITRRMLQQGTPDVDTMVRDDLIAQMALKVDTDALYGDGTGNRPTGIVGTTGVGSVTFAGAIPTWAEVTEMWGDIAGANALMGSLGWTVDGQMAADLMSTVKDVGSGQFIMPDSHDRIIGKAMVSNQIVPGDMIFGNWADLIIAFWSGVDILADPYGANAAKGGVTLNAHQDFDIGLRHPASFTVGSDGV